MQTITTTAELTALCETLARSDYVAVDTEFLREQTFWPLLCLIQLAGPKSEAVVDPLAPGIDLAPFYRLMADTSTVKVFHAARQDIEIIFLKAGIVPAPVVDTQVAAMVCGFGDSISYVNLVKKTTGTDLDKSSRFTDWSRRPLSTKQLDYALADVTYLRNVCAHHKRLWNRQFAIRPRFPSRSLAWPHQVPDNSRLYGMLVVLRHMLRVASPGCQWRERLWALLDAHASVSLEAMKIPADWRGRNLWR